MLEFVRHCLFFVLEKKGCVITDARRYTCCHKDDYHSILYSSTTGKMCYYLCDLRIDTSGPGLNSGALFHKV